MSNDIVLPSIFIVAAASVIITVASLMYLYNIEELAADADKNRQAVEAIKDGADPISVICANEEYKSSSCIIYLGLKEKDYVMD